MSDLPVWLHEGHEKLDSILTSRNIPHAILFAGNAGIGKSELANTFSKALLCKSSINLPCDKCGSCTLFANHTHGDFHHLRCEDSKNNIGIEQSRGAIAFANKTSAYGYRKVVLINPAEKLNRNSSNAILKLLEEPPENTTLILVSSQDGYLPATIHSRCFRITFHSPDRQNAYHWLSKQLPDESEFSKATALFLRQPLKALSLIKTKEFKKLIDALNSCKSRSGLDIDILTALARERNPDKLFLEYLCLQLERFLKEAPAAILGSHASKNIFKQQSELRLLITKIEQGTALNIKLNLTDIVNKLIGLAE